LRNVDFEPTNTSQAFKLVSLTAYHALKTTTMHESDLLVLVQGTDKLLSHTLRLALTQLLLAQLLL
jgi:hypothetical protein